MVIYLGMCKSGGPLLSSLAESLDPVLHGIEQKERSECDPVRLIQACNDDLLLNLVVITMLESELNECGQQFEVIKSLLNDKTVAPLFGLIREDSGVVDSLAIYIPESGLQAVLPLSSTEAMRILADSSLLRMCVRVISEDGSDSAMGLYEVPLHIDDEEREGMIDFLAGQSDVAFFEAACERVDRMIASGFKLLDGAVGARKQLN